MTLYRRTCCYRDLDGDIQSEIKEFNELTKNAALISSENYFYNKYKYLAKDRLLLSSVKTVDETLVIDLKTRLPIHTGSSVITSLYKCTNQTN